VVEVDPAGEPGRAVVGELVETGGVITVRVAGEVDVSSEGRLRGRLDEALQRSPARLVIDASDLTFMDSSGLAALIGAARQVPVELRSPTAPIRRLITLAGLAGTLALSPEA
jgi:anti-anti-sigma factor